MCLMPYGSVEGSGSLFLFQIGHCSISHYLELQAHKKEDLHDVSQRYGASLD